MTKDRTEAEPPLTHRGRPLGLLLLAAPPASLAFATIFGLGLARELSSPLAGLAAFALVLLPAQGLGSLLGGGLRSLLLSLPPWSLLLMVGLSVFFPQDGAIAAQRGAGALSAVFGEAISGAMSELAGGLAKVLGHEAPRPLVEALPPSEEPPVPPIAAAVDEEEQPTLSETVVLPFEGEGRSLRVAVHFDGPKTGGELELLFDTGATFTTLDRRALAILGLPIPEDAPRVTLHTAGGVIEAPLVLLDGVWLGDQRVDKVSVAVCEDCANKQVRGLLGLNVTGQFDTRLDHESAEILLDRRPGPTDRKLDVSHWLKISSEARRSALGRVSVSVGAQNRARWSVAEAVVEVACAEQSFAVTLNDIPGRGERSTQVELPAGTDCRSYRIELMSARW